MRPRLELVTNIIVILVAVAIGSVYLKDRFAAPSPQTDEVKASDKLASLEGWDWGTQDRTLVLVPRKGCHFCEDSSPSYQRLIAQQQAGSKAAVVFTSVTSRTSIRQPHIENPRGALGFGNHRHNQ